MNSNNQTETQHAKSNILNEFLWTCAGVNKAVLRQCPTDYAKYAGTGGTILFTAIMAAISGGYAISSVFQDAPIAVPLVFGIIWGLMIFNLDRFMVNTMYSDGKHTISKEEIKGGLPRIILAFFLGIVISTPLEIRIFHDKIESQLIIDQGKVGDDVRQSNNYWYQQKTEKEDQITNEQNALNDLRAGKVGGISEKIADKEKELNAAELRLYNETNGSGVTKKRGYGPAAKQLQAQVDRLTSEKNELVRQEKETNASNQAYIKQETDRRQKTLDNYQRELQDINKKIAEIENEGRKGQKALTGFCAQYKALGEITSPFNNLSLFLARLCITLLFVSIEVIPTWFKMMITSGPYDDLLRAEMHRIKVTSDKKISDINDEINTSVRISTMKNEKRLEAETIANQDILEKIARAQAELLETAINEWKAIELEKIHKNPSDYVVSLVPPIREMEVNIDGEGNLSEVETNAATQSHNGPSNVSESDESNTNNDSDND
jgi:hypothetical protein